MKVYQSMSQLISNTPILKLSNICKKTGAYADIYAKLECFNPAGSAKDRVALSIIEDAEKKGILTENTVIIEPTSGNTGIGLAAVGASRGYKTVIVMPDTMSMERRIIMSAYGAELVLSDGALGMKGAIAKAEELKEKYPDSLIAGQFTNPANAKAHYETTGPEIYYDMDGKVDIFVAGVGTGGTISGVGRFLKEQNPDIKIVAVEPWDSAVLSGESAGTHAIQGIGAGFIPEILDTEIYDEIIKVTKEQAYSYAKMMGVDEGVLVGISSGAALYAASELSKQQENDGRNIVVLMPDSGERYLSTDLYKE